jgi:hypothetical protein
MTDNRQALPLKSHNKTRDLKNKKKLITFKEGLSWLCDGDV